MTAVGGRLGLPLDARKQTRVQRIAARIKELKHLKWLYEEGPSGNGRAYLGLTNSTGCSSVWASTYPYNPYPFPWVNHLFQDAPSIAIGIFEGHMRKMADGFIAVRRAEAELAGQYSAEKTEAELAKLNWHAFTDEEFHLCPPIIAVGGDGAMMDIGFQNLSRLMASGKPLRVVVLDTQVYSNTGGQACTSGYTGQVSDMAMFGKGQHGKTEVRKELSLITMAHRGVYLLQSSQATASHLIGGVLRGLQSRRPAVFVLNSPCPTEHGTADDRATKAARMALECRAFPCVEYDPDAGETLADRLNLDGNPAIEDDWPTYSLNYLDDDGKQQSMELPMTVADWAATEGRFKKHFRPAMGDEDMVPFAEFVAMSEDERGDLNPFIYVLDSEGKLRRMQVSSEMVLLAEDRLNFWTQLKQLASVEVAESARGGVEADMEAEFDARLALVKAEYEAKLRELRIHYPQMVARRMAESLLQTGDGSQTVADVLRRAQDSKLEPLAEVNVDASLFGNGAAAKPAAPATVAAAAPTASATAVVEAPAAVEDDDDDDMEVEAYIESARCTTCNECTNLNGKMFAYNDLKQAEIVDPKAGTFQQLVKAAEACPVAIIHPGTPLNPKERDLAKWIKRAEPFN
ncbi:MAG: ferredoxin [Planctomycetes bacterium]|nr:ferredoxin [Planctomycetota bacterium]